MKRRRTDRISSLPGAVIHEHILTDRISSLPGAVIHEHILTDRISSLPEAVIHEHILTDRISSLPGAVIHEHILTDRISSLPEAVIHEHILNRLSGKDIKVMSCLSKTWYHLTSSFPFLVFSLPNDEHDNTLNNNYLSSINKVIHRFYDLKNDHILRKLSIPLYYHPTASHLLDSLIDLVLRRGVEEFHFCIVNIDYSSSNSSNRPIFYNLPNCVFSHPNSIIRKAMFRGCSLMHSFLSPLPNVNLIIKDLYLCDVLMDETVLSSIISSCPLIEMLHIDRCMGINKFLRISRLRKLKVLSIVYPEDMNIPVEIDSLSLLRSLYISGGFKVRIIGDYPVLTRLQLIDVRELELQDILLRLPVLHRLKLVRVHSLKNLKVSCVTLSKLEVEDCKNLVGLNIDDAPNLLSVLYSNYSAPPDLLASSSSVQWDVTICYTYGIGVRYRKLEDFLVELNNFVSKVGKMEFFNLYLLKYPLYFNFEELKQRLAQPLVPKIDNLNLFFSEDIRKNHLDVLDGVLWTCHPRTLSLQLGMEDNNHAAVIICKKIMGHRGGRCSCKLGRRSWLHHLDDVSYVTSDGTESRLTMDGTSKKSSLYIVTHNNLLYTKIKFIFNW